MAEPISVTADFQNTPAEAWQNGCGWQTSFTLDVPLDWRSGIYAAQCTDSSGNETYIVFIVKPNQGQRDEIAVLANINTWNAYNSWGGRSKYDGAAVGSFTRPNPSTTAIDDGVVNHLTRAELWVLNWLEDAGYAVDAYSDYDFHIGIDNFDNYKALILSTHPEYWTVEMLDNLEAYLAAGGNLLYLVGNGIFEQCVYNEDADALVFWSGDSSQGRDRNYFRNMTSPRPERSILGVGFLYNNYLTDGFATILQRFAYVLSVLYSVFVTSLAAMLVFTLQKRITRFTLRSAVDTVGSAVQIPTRLPFLSIT